MSPRVITHSAIAATAALVFLFSAAPISATPIVSAGIGTRTNALAFDGAAGDLLVAGSVSPAGLGAGSVSRTAGQSVVTTSYDYSASGGDVILAQTFDHHIDAAGPSTTTGPFNYEELAQSYGSAEFILGADDIGYTYALDGRIEQNGTSRIRLQSSLDDLTAGFSIFMDQGEYYPSTDAYLQTGETDAVIYGSLTGALIAGHTYRLNYTTFTQHWTLGEGVYTNPYGFTPTDAQGHITLTLSGPADQTAAVPEPTTLALFGLGMGVMAFGFRRRK